MLNAYTTLIEIESRRCCRHFLEGTTDIPKQCLHNHECRHCGFDQWLEEIEPTAGRWLEASAVTRAA